MNAKNKPQSFLREAREQLGLSQEEFAAQIGAARVTVARWESGAKRPSPYYRQIISDFFQKEIDELFPAKACCCGAKASLDTLTQLLGGNRELEKPKNSKD